MKEKRYFAGANTTKGFVSYYDEIFRHCKSIYVIKGGSGTGKSRLMRECSDDAEGVGAEVEYFYCSFDPLSLDGIIINGDIAVIDGTAPHVYEPTLPGVKENIIDLGAFWDENKLRESGEDIISLISKKKACFDMAYSYLNAVGALDAAKRKILDKYIERDKISTGAAKKLSEIKPSKNGKAGVRLISALGRSGRVRFDTFEYITNQSIKIDNKRGEGYVYLEEIKKEAERFGVPVTVSYDPLFAGRLNSVIVGDCCIFIDEFEKSEVADAAEIDIQISDLIKKAEVCLESASRIHFDIEKLYVSAMNFDKKEEFTHDFINKLREQIT